MPRRKRRKKRQTSKEEIPTLERSSHRIIEKEQSRLENFPFQLLNKKYIITHQISRGGYGVVYIAYDNPFHIFKNKSVSSFKLSQFFKDIKGTLTRLELPFAQIRNKKVLCQYQTQANSEGNTHQSNYV